MRTNLGERYGAGEDKPKGRGEGEISEEQGSKTVKATRPVKQVSRCTDTKTGNNKSNINLQQPHT